jgi:hypothetical protein
MEKRKEANLEAPLLPVLGRKQNVDDPISRIDPLLSVVPVVGMPTITKHGAGPVVPVDPL